MINYNYEIPNVLCKLETSVGHNTHNNTLLFKFHQITPRIHMFNRFLLLFWFRNREVQVTKNVLVKLFVLLQFRSKSDDWN